MRKRKFDDTMETPNLASSEAPSQNVLTLQRAAALLALYEHLTSHKDSFTWLPRNTAANYRKANGDFRKLIIFSTFLQKRHQYAADTSSIHSFISSLNGATKQVLSNFSHSPKDERIRAFLRQ